MTVYSETARVGALFLKRDLKTVVILNASQVVIARYAVPRVRVVRTHTELRTVTLHTATDMLQGAASTWSITIGRKCRHVVRHVY